eukprot:TRINITY_DN8346_c0_g1_i1.p1 TRINITY_DN8346_c0_g1~~TRINITY_DN8346_c0_g1_i1.p1  ORF type:complete len:735 (+),score=234.82 TRINITY_DN8346_c0_g1_i1:91-2295(+)
MGVDLGPAASASAAGGDEVTPAPAPRAEAPPPPPADPERALDASTAMETPVQLKDPCEEWGVDVELTAAGHVHVVGIRDGPFAEAGVLQGRLVRAYGVPIDTLDSVRAACEKVRRDGATQFSVAVAPDDRYFAPLSLPPQDYVVRLCDPAEPWQADVVYRSPVEGARVLWAARGGPYSRAGVPCGRVVEIDGAPVATGECVRAAKQRALARGALEVHLRLIPDPQLPSAAPPGLAFASATAPLEGVHAGMERPPATVPMAVDHAGADLSVAHPPEEAYGPLPGSYAPCFADASAPKYLIDREVMVLHPAWLARREQAAPSTLARGALAVVSTMDDAAAAAALHQHALGAPMRFAAPTQAALESMQDDGYHTQFVPAAPGAFTPGPGECVDRLTARLAECEAPLGVATKLGMLRQYALSFMVDDSGSMLAGTGCEAAAAGGYMKAKLCGYAPDAHPHYLTRWEEMQDRIHSLIDLIAYVPTGTVTLSFLNRACRVDLPRDRLAPEAWAADAHWRVDQAFAAPPSGGTPTAAALRAAFAAAAAGGGRTMHYLFTDGAPSDTQCLQEEVSRREVVARYPEVTELIHQRAHAWDNPLCLISCTDADADAGDDAAWVRDAARAAPSCAAVASYAPARDAARRAHGPALPYTRGVWLACMLTAAICPDDLGALDAPWPLPKAALDTLMGRVLSVQDYVYYFRTHPNERACRPHYEEFAATEGTGASVWRARRLRPVLPGS